ncbi:uncharacterized protein LOC128668642 isoform X3 [Microplitis demolitor]|uniref:uncharacterized protein LOC128668642 isoform X3 n=1 Tax=Microplitis demolitor TaxID=69319 RepID=UPI00235B6959|nr:uncharacterized protein LOC128668642 isoform X3 [Microplitis demolitor]
MNCKVIYRRKNPRLKFSDKIDDGFSYHCYNTIHDTRYIRCYERRAHGCPARGKITNDELDLSIVHNHVRNPQLQKYCIFQDALFIAATARPYRSLKVIFDDLSVQREREGLLRISEIDGKPKNQRHKKADFTKIMKCFQRSSVEFHSKKAYAGA